MEYLWRHGSSKRWGTERLSAILARRMKATVGASLSVGRYRMVAIAMGREIRGIAERKVEQAAGEADDDDDIDVDPLTGEVADTSSSWNIIWDLQSTHSIKIARQHYAVHVGFIGRLQPEMIASYRGVSRLWHQFLEAEGRCIPDASEGKKRKHIGYEEGDDSPRIAKRQAQDQDEAMIEGLRRLLGPTATWKSLKQRECMQAILRSKGDEASIYVLPTGAGKSILFMLLAILTGRDQRGDCAIRGVDPGSRGPSTVVWGRRDPVRSSRQHTARDHAAGGPASSGERGCDVELVATDVYRRAARQRAAPTDLHRRVSHHHYGC
jgi:hypothetical protein